MIHRSVVTELVYAALYRPTTFQAGLLLGQRSDAGVSIHGYTGLQQTLGPFAHLLETLRDWGRMQARLSEGEDFVGWVCFDPTWSEALPANIQVVHRTLFNLPHQVTALINPTDGFWGLYGAASDGSLTPVPFHLV